MKTGTLIAYFSKQEEAAKAYKKLRRKGYRRSAWLVKSSDGSVNNTAPFIWWRVFGMIAFMIFASFVSMILFKFFYPQYQDFNGLNIYVCVGVVGGVIGIILSLVLIRRSKYGVEKSLLKAQARWMLSQEAALILQAPIERLRTPLTLLQEPNDITPTVFIFHPERKITFPHDKHTGLAMSSTQLQDYAQRLSGEHQLAVKPLRNNELMGNLSQGLSWLQLVCQDISEASRLEQRLPSTAEWLLDNEYILESNVQDVLLNLPLRYYRKLPVLSNTSYIGLPRIYAMAIELTARTYLRLDEQNIQEFVESYQSVARLSIGELWAFPQMLRAALIEGIKQVAVRVLKELHERETADIWANRLISANRRDPNRLFALMSELTASEPEPSAYFASQLFDLLYDEKGARVPVQSWLERTFDKSMNELVILEKNKQASDKIAISNAFISLRQLAMLDWKESFERLSHVEQTLLLDPAGIYPDMDFSTRDKYRKAVEELHHGSSLTEEQVAQQAISLATQSGCAPVEGRPLSHVGTYLIGTKRCELVSLIGGRETFWFRFSHWAFRNHAAIYFLGMGSLIGSVIFLALMLGLPGQEYKIQILFAVLLLIPTSQLALDVMNYLVMRICSPRRLSKMDFSHSGIPDSCRTLVVIPMMLENADSIMAEVEKLEIRYLANKEDNLLFSLFSDYQDAPSLHCETDEMLLDTAKECIKGLNQRYGNERFLLLHRERRWCESEQVFMGWERKRGKLEELNNLIVGKCSSECDQLVYVGNQDQLVNVRFVITLDSDTQLPHDTARRMIETLAHPLIRPRFDDSGRVIAGTYTIIQPRVTPSLPSTSSSLFSRLFSDSAGIDPYTNTVSDAYQDMTGEGSYHGKGIYDVRAFSQVLSGRFPESRLLSHDLIEGSYVRVGLASDIELFDAFPKDYLSYMQRQHRWIRGDWQIASWIMPRVPHSDGQRVTNLLSGFDRWKIFDNLRRSLLPVTSMALLLIAWFTSPWVGGMATIVVATQLFFHSLAQPFTWATNMHSLQDISPIKICHDLLRVLAEAALLPCQSWLAMDAIARVFYRLFISHQKLLEWTSVQVNHVKGAVAVYLFYMSFASIFGLIASLAIIHFMPASIWVACPWLVLWVMSLLIGWILCRQSRVLHDKDLLTESGRLYMRTIARRTWRYFTDLVDEKTSWLPADNYQVSHQNRLAMRSSPTNIGLYLASVLNAKNFGYLTVDGVAKKLAPTMETITKLERYNGHLLNWYNIATLSPLEPRYVSTVDSGNLLGALWAIDQGLEMLKEMPLLDAEAFAGIRDTVEILRQAIREEKLTGWNTQMLSELARELENPPERVMDALRLLRRLAREVGKLAESDIVAASGKTDMKYWVGQLQSQFTAWLDIGRRYMGWIEILEEKTEEELSILSPDIIPIFKHIIHTAPSLKGLAETDHVCNKIFEIIRKQEPTAACEVLDWIERITVELHHSQLLAVEMQAGLERLAEVSRELSTSTNMAFLYNVERRLFSIGFNVSEGRIDNSFYDILASEVRLGSFISIARGDIPVNHWFAMNRPYGSIDHRRTLLSWSGTMFEYLMPLLFQRSYGNTLLDKAAKDAVDIQIAFGRKNKIPWGVSECAFADLDHDKTYQYYAFGVPELGLKCDLPKKMVVSPYSTLLAVNIVPQQAFKNLKKLEQLGLLSDYGFYEAIDFSRKSGREGDRGVIVRTYMAHHQGMSFLALANFLQNDCLRHEFYADPRVRAFELLLYEHIPHLPQLQSISKHTRVSSVDEIEELTPSFSQFETPHTTTPKTQLFCNGHYALMLTNSGGGYSHWNEFELTRWRSDCTSDSYGNFCYIHDTKSNKLWCNTYQPTGGQVEKYGVNFSIDRAVFKRVDNKIAIETEVFVAQEDDVEIRRMTLINRSDVKRQLNLTSYFELVLAPHRADLQHSAFNKMFIQTEAIPEKRTLIAWRRPRSDSEKPVFAAHRFTLEQHIDDAPASPLFFETDRRQFIGRGSSLASPLGARQKPGNSQGYVLDPILSLRQEITLEPGQRLQVSLVLAAGDSREQVLSMMDKYSEPHAIVRAIDFARVSAQLEMRLLRIQPDDARRFQQLASYLLYHSLFLRSSAKIIAENRKGQAGLWSYSISGDLPIALVAISEASDIGFIHQMIQAHAFWHLQGLAVDLIVLIESNGGYMQPLLKEIEHLIQNLAPNTEIGKSGGIFLRAADQISTDDLVLLRSAASVSLVAARGTLAQQLGAAQGIPVSPEAIIKRKRLRDISAALPFLDLLFFNSLGGFTQNGKEYAIYLGANMNTPAPWVNVIANPAFGTLISETGAGFTWHGNSQRNRLTQWSNDPVLDTPSEAIYIRDDDTGNYWTPTASPIRDTLPYRARHGAGYTVFEHNSHGVNQELTVFVPVSEHEDEPVKLQKLMLYNDSTRVRNLSLTYYVEWTLGESRENSQMQVVTSWDDEIHAILAHNYYNPDYPHSIAFAAMSLPVISYTADRMAFLGRNRSMVDPAALGHNKLLPRVGAGLDPCAALQATLVLLPGESKEIVFTLGQSSTLEEVHEIVTNYNHRHAVDGALQKTQSWWDQRLETVQAHTPELGVDLLLNRWLLYQTLSCRIWARSGFYQSGGAFGFRDQLQDVMALLYAHPQLAREHILLAASHQFKEGDVQHWWHPPGGEGIRSRISDDLLWLPFVVTQYIQVTADTSILQEMSPFLDAPLLSDDQHESFQNPVTAEKGGTLFEHCQRALSHGMNFGAHGLPLMGTGDWNDGMNLVGVQGKGESVWLAWFMIDVLRGMAEMSKMLDRAELADTYDKQRELLAQEVEKFAWDGEWYLRATFDDGIPLGSAVNEEAKIDSLPQSWACLSAAADPERAHKALESAWNYLVDEDEKQVQLFTPPFDKMKPSPGYIMGYPPGVRENGGQYTHAAIWVAMAMARCGDGERAAKILCMLNPIEHARDSEAVGRYQIEPYVVAADVYRLQGHIGQGGWSWYTGSASWMYRAWIEEILGLNVRGDTLQISPVIPEAWEKFQISYRHGEAFYDIFVDNPEHCQQGVVRVELNGQHIEDGVIHLARDMVKHTIRVLMGK